MRTPTTVFGPTTTIGSCALGAQALDQVVHLGGVAARVNAIRDVPDDALLVDDESGTHQALAPCAALVLLLLQHAVLAAHLALGVGEERDGNAVTVAEIGVRQAIVARDAEHHAVVLNKLLFVVGEISRDQGAAGRAVARIEVEHHVLLALERRQRDGLHVGVGQLEGRCGLSRLQHRERFYAKTFFKLQQPAPPRAVVSSLHIIVAVNSFLLGGLTPREFLRRHWQKQPLFVRGALPRFAGVLDERQLRALAARDDVEARVVERHGRRYQTVHGPFKSVRPEARYRDPGLGPARAPARIPREMVAFADRLLSRIRWTRGDVERFLGEYLSAPKAHIVFRPQAARRLAGRVRLDPRSQLLYSGRRFFINGDSLTAPAGAAAALRRLADDRSAAATALAGARLARLISDWQRRGYVRVESA